MKNQLDDIQTQLDRIEAMLTKGLPKEYTCEVCQGPDGEAYELCGKDTDDSIRVYICKKCYFTKEEKIQAFFDRKAESMWGPNDKTKNQN